MCFYRKVDSYSEFQDISTFFRKVLGYNEEWNLVLVKLNLAGFTIFSCYYKKKYIKFEVISKQENMLYTIKTQYSCIHRKKLSPNSNEKINKAQLLIMFLKVVVYLEEAVIISYSTVVEPDSTH